MRQPAFSRWFWALGLGLLILAGCDTLTVPSTTPTPTTAAPTQTTSATGAPGTPTAVTTTWASFLVATTQGRGNPLSIKNINPISGKNVEIATVTPSNQAVIDSISPDGQLVAYHLDDGAGNQSFSIARVDGSGSHPVAQVKKALGHAIWLPDGKHLAVGTEAGVVILDSASTATTTASPTQAFLVFASPDGKVVYGTGTGTNDPQGTLLRIPLDGSAFLALTARVTAGHYLLSADGTQVFYQNTGPTGTPGIYQVNTQTGSQTQVRDNKDIPVGFSTKGNLLTVHVADSSPTWSLNQLGATAADDKVLAAQLLPTGVAPANDVVSDVAVAPDGTAVIIRGSPATTNFRFYFLDLSVAGTQPKSAFALDNASRADLVGWDSVLLPASS